MRPAAALIALVLACQTASAADAIVKETFGSGGKTRSYMIPR